MTQASTIQDMTPDSIPDEEPIFVIRGQDLVGGAAVRAWVDLARAAGARSDILERAMIHSRVMDAWPHKKIPDLS